MKYKFDTAGQELRERVISSEKKISTSLNSNMMELRTGMAIDKSFDLIYRVVDIGGRNACMYFVNGFCKDDTIQKLLEYFIDIKDRAMPDNVHDLSKSFLPYGSVDIYDEWKTITYNILSGVFALFIDGYDKCILIDVRAYPARSVTEPEKDKALRGSKDGFVETIVSNTTLIRRRIRSADLRMEMLKAGKSSQTDIVLCYMESRADKQFLQQLRDRINELKIDALTMNQESLAECLYTGRHWINPFPKFKFTERPDTAAAQILEGDIIILVDNSPSAMITPTSVFDILEEADDYYFPPVTSTYLRFARLLIAVITFILSPLFLLLMNNPNLIPQGFEFISVKEPSNIPLIWQFLMLELAIDGLRLAAVNTPSMLSTPLSVMAALVLGEFSTKSGWFNAEVMLYMAFIALAGYTQASYELSYALKFLRIISLILTQFFGIYGFIAGICIMILTLLCNKTIAGQSYLYPFLPFDLKKFCRRVFRTRLPEAKR